MRSVSISFYIPGNLSVLLENPRNNPVVTDYRQFTSVISRAFFDGCPMTMVNDVNSK